MTDIKQIIVSAPSDGEIVDPSSWFESPGPVEIEIGCGKGGFLLHRVQTCPEVRILGVEWANKYFLYCADRMARRGQNNVRVMRTDARELVISQLPTACIATLHVYHPDPWPKRRHHRRRLVQPDFVSAVERILVPGGLWLIQTDHAEYFEWITATIGGSELLNRTEFGVDELGADWGGTNFEIKYTREGRDIFRVAYVRS